MRPIVSSIKAEKTIKRGRLWKMTARRREPIIKESGRLANTAPIDCANPFKGFVAIVPAVNSLYIGPSITDVEGAVGSTAAYIHKINSNAGVNNIRTIRVINDPVSIYFLLRFF